MIKPTRIIIMKPHNKKNWLRWCYEIKPCLPTLACFLGGIHGHLYGAWLITVSVPKQSGSMSNFMGILKPEVCKSGKCSWQPIFIHLPILPDIKTIQGCFTQTKITHAQHVLSKEGHSLFFFGPHFEDTLWEFNIPIESSHRNGGFSHSTCWIFPQLCSITRE